MTCRLLRAIADNKVEGFGVIENVALIPRVGEIVNAYNNRFVVRQVEWSFVNSEVLVYVEDVPVAPVAETK